MRDWSQEWNITENNPEHCNSETYRKELEEDARQGKYCPVCKCSECLVDQDIVCCHTQVQFGTCHHNFVSAYPGREEERMQLTLGPNI